MKKLALHLVSIFILILVITGIVFSQDKPAGKVSGLLFGDYFYKIAGTSTAVSSSQFSSVAQDFQAFQLRRAYLFYDHNINDNFAANFLLEGNDKTVDGNSKYSVFIKTAYLEMKNVVPLGSILLGIIPTPTWALGQSEKVWNYRSVEKTVIDFRGMGDASDVGVGIKGKFDAEGTLNYAAMIGNGNSQKNENNKYKKYYFNLNAKLAKSFILEGYIDYEPLGTDQSKMTLLGFLAYSTPELTVGFEGVQQNQKVSSVSSADINKLGLSFFAWGKVLDGLSAFARYDMFKPNTNASSVGWSESFMLFGVDYQPIKEVHIMPNIWINSFKDNTSAGRTKESDVVGRVTFYYTFNR